MVERSTLTETVSRNIGASVVAVVDCPLDGPAQGAFWLIEAVSVQLSPLQVSGPQDTPAAGQSINQLALQVTKPGQVAAPASVLEGWRQAATLPIARAIAVSWRDSVGLEAVIRNDTAAGWNGQLIFFVQYLEVTSDSPNAGWVETLVPRGAHPTIPT